ncbi:MAG: response regulator [Planctomycetota bacterium]
MAVFAHALIVDDARFMRCVLIDALTPLCGAIAEAADLDAALHQARRQPMDLVTVDLAIDTDEMVQGLELIRALKQEALARYMVVVSAIDQEWVREATRDAGASAYIPKPFAIEDLRRRLRHLVEVDHAGQ